jgi:type II secretory pathway component PulM
VILSKRERFIGIATGAVVALLALDWFIFTPLLERRTQVQADITIAQVKFDRATLLFNNTKAVNTRWGEMLSGGLKADASAAESQVLQAVHDWARESGLNMSSIKRERTDKVNQFQQVTLRAAANGNMGAASRFLWRVQTARIPVRITDLLISSTRKEGTDDLSLTLGISTIYLAPEPRKGETPSVQQTATAWEGHR